MDICRVDSESEPEGSSIRVEKGVGRGLAEETKTLVVDGFANVTGPTSVKLEITEVQGTDLEKQKYWFPGLTVDWLFGMKKDSWNLELR